MNLYENLLNSEFQYDKFYEYCTSIFKYGDFDKIDDLLVLIIPLVNVVYYQSICRYDDNCVAKDDLIQDALSTLLHDMKYKWDKYIHVDDYYDYIRTILRNSMYSRLSQYHSYGVEVEYDVDTHGSVGFPTDSLLQTKEDLSIVEGIKDLTWDLVSHRLRRVRLLQEIYERVCIQNLPKHSQLQGLNRYQVHGISSQLLQFYRGRVYYLYQLSSTYYKALLKEDEEVLRSTEDIISRIKSSEYEILAVAFGDTPIPELYAELGKDSLLKLISIVGGTTVKFPTTRDLSDTILGSTVYALADGRVENLESVSEIYHYSYKTLKRIFHKHTSNLQKRSSYRDKI